VGTSSFDKVVLVTRVGLMLDGRYRLLEALGRGGMGEVWRARHERLDRDVAVKVLPQVGVASPIYAKLFQSEAKAAARLQHPGITVVHDFGAEQELLYLVMELLPGESLEEVIAHHPEGAALGEVCSWGAQVAEALAAAHAAGVVHRDIKPANLMLLPGGHVKVCDFGLARLQDATGTVTAAGMGTAAYMAPEQITEGAVDGRTDIYALGCTLFHLFIGRPPFEADTRWGVARKQLDEEPPTVRSLRPGVPETVDRLLQRMLAKDPAERPQHPREVAAVLARAAQPTETPSQGATPRGRGPRSAVAAASPSSPKDTASPKGTASSKGPAHSSAPSEPLTVIAWPASETRERITMLVTAGLLGIGVWTFVVAALFGAWDAPPMLPSIIAVHSTPTLAIGTVLLMLLLHRTPRIGPLSRTTGLWVAGGSLVIAFLLSLLLFRYSVGIYQPEIAPETGTFLIAVVGPPMVVLSMAGPGLALLGVWQSGSFGGSGGRIPPLWIRTAFGAVLLLLAVLAVVFLGMWAFEAGAAAMTGWTAFASAFLLVATVIMLIIAFWDNPAAAATPKRQALVTWAGALFLGGVLLVTIGFSAERSAVLSVLGLFISALGITLLVAELVRTALTSHRDQGTAPPNPSTEPR
jgi:serine/threonine protein kinase